MSDDIVDRLRVVQCCVFEPRCERCQAGDAAAAEIARLRDANKELGAQLVRVFTDYDRLWDGIAEHKLRVDDPSAPAKAVREYDLRLWALIEEGDDAS